MKNYRQSHGSSMRCKTMRLYCMTTYTLTAWVPNPKTQAISVLICTSKKAISKTVSLNVMSLLNASLKRRRYTRAILNRMHPLVTGMKMVAYGSGPQRRAHSLLASKQPKFCRSQSAMSSSRRVKLVADSAAKLPSISNHLSGCSAKPPAAP